METNPNHFRQAASHRGRDFVVTFAGRNAILVQSVWPITGDCRTVWKYGRPMGDLTKAAVGNARMRDPRGILAPMNDKPPIPELTPLTPGEEERFLSRLAAHPSAGEGPGDSVEVMESILAIGRARIARRAVLPADQADGLRRISEGKP